MSEVLSKSRLARLSTMGEGTIVAELTTRIAELGKIELQWLTYQNEIGKVEDLEKGVARLKKAAETWHNRNRDNCQRLNDKIAVVGAARESAEQEVARLSDHIRAIADYHDGLKYSLLDGVRSLAWELHHTERRDFALSILEEK